MKPGLGDVKMSFYSNP